jgi:hypothetical protein
MDIKILEISGGVWGTTPVSETPEIVLEDWAILQLPDGDRYFAGQNITEDEGRASSKIVTFDQGTLKGVTASGRVYQLQGPPGLRGDGAYVWQRWCSINDITDFVNISSFFVVQA